MKRLLLITYYWPPAGGVAVQRWLQMSKHLPDFGWQPTVFTAAGADYPNEDFSLFDQVRPDIKVLRQPITEPYAWYRRLTKRGQDEQMYSAFNETEKTPGLAQRAAIWVRANAFIPDARVLWIRPSVRRLRWWLSQNKVDAVVTNGPPHSTHLIGLALKKRFPELPWIADFRDPWTAIDYYAELPLTSWADRRHRRLEREVMATADHVVTVSPSWAADFRKIAGHDRVSVVTNGFDGAQFADPPPPLDEKFTLLHSGIMGKDRNYPVLWQALRTLLDEEPNFATDLQLDLIGELDAAVARDLDRYGLRPYVRRTPFLPHAEVIDRTRRAHLLLLLINQLGDNAPGRLPSKLYEYLGAGRPVLCLSPVRGDAAKILEETGAGMTFDAGAGAGEFLQKQYANFRREKETRGLGDVSQYGRRELSYTFATILDRVSG